MRRRRWTIDTNVPVVANGPDDAEGSVSFQCRRETIEFLVTFLRRRDRAVVDQDGKIIAEYRRYLKFSGQPGVGDRFYRELLHNSALVERVELTRRKDNEYSDLPQPIIDSGFDRNDRKFAALAKRERIPVVNAVDSDWLEHKELLKAQGIRVKFLCGCNKKRWYQ